MKHARALLCLSLLTAIFGYADARAATKSYAVNPALEPLVTTLAATIERCVHKSDYIGPIKIKSINLVAPNIATADVSLGLSGDSAANIILQRARTGWTCTGGNGGTLNATALRIAHVPAKDQPAILAGKGIHPLLARPIFLPATQKQLFTIQTPGH